MKERYWIKYKKEDRQSALMSQPTGLWTFMLMSDSQLIHSKYDYSYEVIRILVLLSCDIHQLLFFIFINRYYLCFINLFP